MDLNNKFTNDANEYEIKNENEVKDQDKDKDQDTSNNEIKDINSKGNSSKTPTKNRIRIREQSDIQFLIGSNNYISQFYNDYLLLYNNNLPTIINIQKKFDPLFLSSTAFQGFSIHSP